MQNIIIKKMRITEKGTDLQSRGTYVLSVGLNATKNEIKKAVKQQYGVDAVSVNTLRARGHARRYRGMKSAPKTYKKAMVTLKEGQSIKIN